MGRSGKRSKASKSVAGVRAVIFGSDSVLVNKSIKEELSRVETNLNKLRRQIQIAQQEATDIGDLVPFSGDYSNNQIEDMNLGYLGLIGASFAGVQGKTIHFAAPSEYFSSSLTEANLSKSFFQESNFNGCDLNDANLSGARIINSNLSRANLKGSNLKGALIINSKLEGLKSDALDCLFDSETSFSKSWFVDSEGAFSGPVDSVDFSGARFQDFVFRDGQSFREANFCQTEFINTTAQSSRFLKANLSFANIKDSKLDQSEFQEAYFTSATATGSSFKEANFKSAKMDNFKAAGCSFFGASFGKASLKGATFIDCDLRNIKIDRHSLSEAEFIDCQLDWGQ